MKTTPVYKVVSFIGKTLRSAYAPNPFAKTYKVGSTTLPMKGTKLFAFTNLKQARDYASASCAVVYKAEATGVEKNGWFNQTIYDLAALRYAFEKHEMEPPSKCYSSCVVCDSIKLLKRV